MNNNRILLVGWSALILLVGWSVWGSIFRLQLPKDPKEGISKSYDDSLSGTYVSKDSINNITHTNPRAPYYVAFDKLSYYGASDSDIRYIQGFITNYMLYNEKLEAPILSFVEGSFKGPFIESEGFVTTYNFRFGIDKTHQFTVSVASETKGPSIDITLSKAGKTVAHKNFLVYYAN